MRFQLFGWPFDFPLDMAMADAEAQVRAGQCDWFDPSVKAVGWILPPFFGLRLGRRHRYSPLILGRLIDTETGARVSGRIGFTPSDFIFFMLILPIWAMILFGFAMFSGYFVTNEGLVITAVGVLILLAWRGFSRGRDPERWAFLENRYGW